VLLLPASLAQAAGSQRRAVQAVVEGAVLAGYRFVAHKSEDQGGAVERFVVVGVGLDAAELAEGTRRGVVVADAVCLARDLINEPPSSLTPTRFADTATDHGAGRPGLTVEVWDEQRIVDERLGGLLGVARGSAEPPRLLKISYEPENPVTVGGRVPHIVLVGKGITFDSGGLSLKTAEGMVTMKTDMSGAAAVVGAVSACGELGVRVRVTAIAPTTENMPGGRATKPGDVLTIRNGRTIEVLNTDAEGRLVLADGLSLAAELEPDAIIDLATLTGACVVALGMSIAGVFGSDDGLIGAVRAASDRAGEGTWPLPLPEEYRSHIDSEIADMKNIGKGGQAGAIAAALLLARFVDEVPWVHLDIAGPARSDEDSGILAKGGTGFGVRTLLELLERYSAGE
jgi:leucyl aminopeptidase